MEDKNTFTIFLGGKMNYINCIYVALGGALGAVSRYLLSTMIQNKTGSLFPWGTYFVNISGCFFLGFVYILGVELLIIPANIRTFVSVGFLGAFTTFSTFNLESLHMINNGEYRLALYNIFGSIICGLFAVWLGLLTARIITK